MAASQVVGSGYGSRSVGQPFLSPEQQESRAPRHRVDLHLTMECHNCLNIKCRPTDSRFWSPAGGLALGVCGNFWTKGVLIANIGPCRPNWRTNRPAPLQTRVVSWSLETWQAVCQILDREQSMLGLHDFTWVKARAKLNSFFPLAASCYVIW